MGRPVSKVTRAPVTGPLAPFAPTLRMRLRASGYTPLTMVNVMRLMAHLSQWLEASGIEVGDLSREQAKRYITARRTWLTSTAPSSSTPETPGRSPAAARSAD
jgi:hypothetical protein